MSTMTHDTIETKPLDTSRPVQQRNGRPARLCQRQSDEPFEGGETLVVERQDSYGKWKVYSHYADGRFYRERDTHDDIINIPEAPRTRTVWLNRYPDKVATEHDTVDLANECAAGNRIGPAIPVEVPCEVPKPATKTIKRFHNFDWDGYVSRGFETRALADNCAHSNRAECREITWEVPV